MVGRRRRGTSSSTESAVPDQLRYRPEASVLKPVPFDTPENNWPTFELDDAVILSKDGRELENALDVILKGPFIVRGRMIVEDQEQRSHLVSRVRAPVPIEIWPCQRYSIGETEGGKMSDDGDEDSEADARPILSVLWVSGQGGWFEVNPAPAYIPIYRDICDAIKLFYALFDIYQNADAKFKKAENGERDPTGRLAPLFMKYAVRVGSGITFEEVEKRCLDVAPFLISQFLDDINFWKKTYLYQWFKETHEDIFKKISHFKRNPKPNTTEQQSLGYAAHSVLPRRSRMESSPPPPPPPEKLNDRRRSSSRARSTRSASTAVGAQVHALVQVPTSTATSMMEYAPREEVVHHAASSAQNARRGVVKPSPLVHNHIPPRTEEDESSFESVFSIFSGALDHLDDSTKGVTFNGLTNKLYFDHKFPNFKNGQSGCHRIPVEEVLHYNAAQLLKRMDNKYRNTEVYTWLQERSAIAFKPIAIKLSDFPYQLVPRQKQTVPRGQKGLAQLATTNHGDSSLDRETLSNDRSESPRAGKGLKVPGRRPKMSSLRLASSKKRPYSDVDGDSESDASGAGTKKSHFFQDAQDADESMEDAGDTSPAHELESTVQIVIQADKMPSAVPRGHHGTWTCDHDDCDYIVRAGDEAGCQARINEHFEHHEQQAERVQLAISEGTRGHTQINNLLEKIKRLGEQQQQETQPQVTPRNGVVVPQPIKTNLIV